MTVNVLHMKFAIVAYTFVNAFRCCFKFCGMHLMEEVEEEEVDSEVPGVKHRRATTIVSGEVEVEQRM